MAMSTTGYAYALLPVLGHNLKQRRYHTKLVYLKRLVRLAATALRLRFSIGVSKCR